jgi:hypothetical protein
LFAFGAGLSGCPSSLTTTTNSNLCAQACTNYAARCGLSGSSSFSSSSSGTTQDCVSMCNSGLGSKSGSSSTEYKDLLACVANAKSCLEVENVCHP